ncbi:MAG: hypothetical protein Q9221_000167 [Calogaya cf. arnoldii]
MLTAATTTVMGKVYGGPARPFDHIDDEPDDRARGNTIDTSHMEYDTPTRHYKHIDWHGHDNLVKDIETDAERRDGVILVVSATDRPMSQVRISLYKPSLNVITLLSNLFTETLIQK